MKKVDMVRAAVASGELKTALRIAKGFRIRVTAEQQNAMSLAYECMLYPDFYSQLGMNIPETIDKGVNVLKSLYG